MGSKSQTTKVKNEPWSPARDDLRGVLDATQSAFNDGTLTANPYGGQRVADMSAQTSDALAGLSQESGLFDPSVAALQEIIGGQNMYRDFDTIRGTVADEVKMGLGNTFSGGSLHSGLAQDTYTRAMTEALAGVEFGAYNDAQNRRMTALGMAPAVSAMGMDENKAALGGGTLLDEYNQRQIDSDMGAYYENENTDLDAIREYAALAGGIGGMGGNQTSREPVSLMDQFKTAGTAISAGTMLLCDGRLKTDLHKVGETPRGRPIYNFRYLWSLERFIGPIAQDVPEAIVGYINGFAFIDLARVE